MNSEQAWLSLCPFNRQSALYVDWWGEGAQSQPRSPTACEFLQRFYCQDSLRGLLQSCVLLNLLLRRHPQENLDVSPAEENLDVSPAEENLDVSPAEENLDVSPAEENLDVSPAEKNFDVSLAEENLDNSPGEENLEVSPAEENVDVSPAEETLDVSPAEENLDVSPAEEDVTFATICWFLRDEVFQVSLLNCSASQKVPPAPSSWQPTVFMTTGSVCISQASTHIRPGAVRFPFHLK